jgi:hypothetical protein
MQVNLDMSPSQWMDIMDGYQQRYPDGLMSFEYYLWEHCKAK